MRRSTVLLTSALLAFRLSAAVSPPVQVNLRSSWPAPPPLLEAIETISDQDSDAFFPLVHEITTHDRFSGLQDAVPSEIYAWVMDVAIQHGLLVDAGAGSVAATKMGLGLHTAVPKIEAFYQHYLDRQAARKGTECGSWVDWYGQVVCDVETLVHLAGVDTIDPAGGLAGNATYTTPKLLSFDHVRPATSRIFRPPRTAILYASLTSPNFRSLHEYLYTVSDGSSPHLEYVLRPIPPGDRDESKRSYLSGYGVALDLKKMEYLAIDDRSNQQESKVSDSRSETDSISQTDPIVTLLHQYLENATADYTSALTSDELLSIGLQSAQLIYDSNQQDLEDASSASKHDPMNVLNTLKKLSQDFPKYASTVARRVVVEPKLQEEVYNNGVKVMGGVSAVWLNGVVIQEKDMNPFSLLRFMKKERSIILALIDQGLTSEQAVTLLTHKTVGAAQSESAALEGLFDASDRPEGGDLIMWWNDFETDSRYAKWGNTLRLLLRPMYPGQFPSIKMNIFNIVLAVDLSQSSSLNFIGSAVNNIINRQFPFRFGVVPVVETEAGLQMASLFYWLVDNVGREKTMEFIQRIGQLDTPPHLLTFDVQWPVVRSEFKGLVSSLTSDDLQPTSLTLDVLKNTNFDDVVLGKVVRGADVKLEKARSYATRLNLNLESASQGSAFVNGKWYELNDEFLRNMQTEIGVQMQHLQEELYGEKITEEQTAAIATYFYDQPSSLMRRNKYIFPSTKTGSLKIVSLPDLHARSGLPLSGGAFAYPVNDESDGVSDVPLTTYVVADLDSHSGKQLVKEALLSSTARKDARVTFIHNPSSSQQRSRPVSSLLGQLIANDALSQLSPSRLLEVLPLEDVEETLGQDDQTVLQIGDDLLDGFPLPDSDTMFLAASRYVISELQLKPGEQVVGPFGENEFLSDDIQALTSFEYRKRVEPVIAALKDIFGSLENHTRVSLATLISATSSIVSAIRLPDPSEAGLFNTPQRPRLRNYQLLSGDYTKYEFGRNDTALLHFGFIVDPLSEIAQKWSSIIEWLLNDPSVFVELHINPARYRDLPLKRFYRYNLPGELAFDQHGKEAQSLAVFSDLPVEPVYTLAMDVPQSWLVRPRESQYDLDNIQLGVLSENERDQGVQATFDLDYLVIEGHAREGTTLTPPRGLQLQLSTTSSRDANDTIAIADTQVVANLGYLQFRVKPGVFKLEIRPGRGRDVFLIDSVGNEGWESPDVDAAGDEVTLTSFEGLTLYPRFKRVLGMESVDVLAVDVATEDSKGFIGDVLSGFSSMFSSKPVPTATDVVTVDDHAEINIFTVASGLLYERFASIMILSVLRNTNSTVKFWFIENFLSPSFLEFIPHFAKAYDFKYELVTYKWPSWLRAQKEKQRIIWAYKILFLDVLFPMDLKKVIFVDADQIVRADLKELVDLDLHGAPYGYTPMGDDNTDMEGFRFWKTGYWKDFLQGLPYHISALYVVDLVRFRQMAAGDILRGHYQQLSADPGSLSNLDQDLPNNLQREVPIFSLPEDWLWCETWCSKDRLSRAKTIDLCQNPLTKEPKLARARQISEWSTYDAEIAQFARQLAERGHIRSGMVTADTNVLADQAAGVKKSVEQEVEITDSPDQHSEIKDASNQGDEHYGLPHNFHERALRYIWYIGSSQSLIGFRLRLRLDYAQNVDVERKLDHLRETVSTKIRELQEGQSMTSEITWLQAALHRTEDYYRNGPRGPVAWVLTVGHDIPKGAFVAGLDGDEPLYAARGFLQGLGNQIGTLQVGKASERLRKGAALGYGWREYHVDLYETLVASNLDLRWVPMSGSVNLAMLGARPVEGGYEAPASEPLYVGQAYLANAWRPGKTSAQLGGAFIPFGGKEVLVERTQITSSEETHNHVEKIVKSATKDQSELLTLPHQDGQVALDILWKQWLKPSRSSNDKRREIRGRIILLSKTYGSVPRALLLSASEVQKPEPDPRFSGNTTDIFFARFDNQDVALKRLRVFLMFSGTPKSQVTQEFFREAIMWRTLSHSHIVPLLGLGDNIFNNTPCMVLPWMDNGTIVRYSELLRERGEMSEAVRSIRLNEWLFQIASGLAYLHSEDIVHGALRGSNILIDSKGSALLTDFGMARIIQLVAETYATMPTSTIRWQSPELLDPDAFQLEYSSPTIASDMYSFALTCIELVTMKQPFSDLTDYKVVAAVVRGKRPERPKFDDGGEILEDLWTVISDCWEQNPSRRPTAGDVVNRIGVIVKDKKPSHGKRRQPQQPTQASNTSSLESWYFWRWRWKTHAPPPGRESERSIRT
ncbi:hypothetical protein EUX98_g5002 [Antrodiella citrinella]|uniref:Protein kinase domain-containing protein n=1 Tax=Antrodiella citrinella TaxID=2447956 RepID=A0A4S4MTJ5_9APHY|nr:hypothetical protein EUX98_g5002 [Antrodiella citrinella]